MSRGCIFDSDRKIVQNWLKPSPNNAFEVGIRLGSMARAFGARAPLDDIAHRILYDCMRSYIHADSQLVVVKHSGGRSDSLDLEYFCWIQDGIDTVLYE